MPLKPIFYNNLATQIRLIYRRMPSNNRVKGLTYRLSERLNKVGRADCIKHKIRWKYKGNSVW